MEIIKITIKYFPIKKVRVLTLTFFIGKLLALAFIKLTLS